MSLIGFISDAHGNKRAFDHGIEILLEQGVESFFFLGDAVGYIPSLEVLNSIEKLRTSIVCIKGNHEHMLLSNKSHIANDEVYKIGVIKKKMTDKQMSLMSAWPEKKSLKIGDCNILIVHGSPSDPTSGYIYPDTDLNSFRHNANWVFTGHTHRPFIRNYSGIEYVNVGSCGLPRDDGRYASVAIFDSKIKTTRIIRYSIEESLCYYFNRYNNIHSSVKELSFRRSNNLVGEIYE